MRVITSLIFLIGYLQLCTAFMKIIDFANNDFLRCYDSNVQDSRRISKQNIHGQPLPLPNSIETFISLLERYESLQPTAQLSDTVEKLLKSFRIDGMDPDLEERQYRNPVMSLENDIERAFFKINGDIQYDFSDEDFSDDEKCALHLMLSHTINDTRIDEGAEFNSEKAKQPLELGVVSLHSKSNHAFALGRVLLGIYAAYQPSKEVAANSILSTVKSKTDQSLANVNVNPVFSVTIGDLVSKLIGKGEFKILPNGMWNDVSCPTEFKLEDNNDAYVSLSELRGAIDGLIIGKKIQENRDIYTNFKLSQILRMYYGYSGLLDNERTRWCQRDRAFNALTDLKNEIINFNNLLKVINGGLPGEKVLERVNYMVSEIKNNVFKDIDTTECGITDTSPNKKYTSPRNIFAILDYSNPTKLKFQAEIIGNLSSDFDIRPRGNLFGVYTNMKPIQQQMLDTVAKSSGTAGCPSCFVKYFSRQGNKEDEAEVFRDLNSTLTAFEEEYDELEEKYQDTKGGSPGKVVLYFNFGTLVDSYAMQDALWEIKRHFGGVTILAVGDNVAGLKFLVENEQTDIFTDHIAEKAAKDIKERLKKVPGEFQFKACNQSSQFKEAENKKQVFITPNKMQYWAMYPQYFLKSYQIKLKFKAQEGTTVSVCFGRWYKLILNNDPGANCQTSNGEEIEFIENNPCEKKNVYNCDPFYFSVEARKQPQQYCENLRCNTPKDIYFEFQHEGIFCNAASYVTISNMTLMLVAMLLYFQRH